MFQYQAYCKQANTDLYSRDFFQTNHFLMCKIFYGNKPIEDSSHTAYLEETGENSFFAGKEGADAARGKF